MGRDSLNFCTKHKHQHLPCCLYIITPFEKRGKCWSGSCSRRVNYKLSKLWNHWSLRKESISCWFYFVTWSSFFGFVQIGTLMDHSYAWGLWIVVRKKMRTSPFQNFWMNLHIRLLFHGELVQNVDLKKMKVYILMQIIANFAKIWFDHTPKTKSPRFRQISSI